MIYIMFRLVKKWMIQKERERDRKSAQKGSRAWDKKRERENATHSYKVYEKLLLQTISTLQPDQLKRM